MPSIVRFVLVLVAAVALLLMATPGAFAASAHSASHASTNGKAIPKLPNGCGETFGSCDALLLDGQSSVHLYPSLSSVDCTDIHEFGNLYECDVTLSGSFFTSQPINWVATTTNLGTIHVTPSQGTLAPGQSVTVRIYPLSSSVHGSITFAKQSGGTIIVWSATAYWN